ncbi:hypothetical protein [Pseudooceanicola aestuarii]|uniref:hypothetical protein n=1 Tax=Pseudooceanicola aestuarii TaxID=2697319 RepID=UPI0013D7C915|nr:hypothetical protein [Pseudooceanicola aestuarii]
MTRSFRTREFTATPRNDLILDGYITADGEVFVDTSAPAEGTMMVVAQQAALAALISGPAFARLS